jgi:hypothetical protein
LRRTGRERKRFFLKKEAKNFCERGSGKSGSRARTQHVYSVVIRPTNVLAAKAAIQAFSPAALVMLASTADSPPNDPPGVATEPATTRRIKSFLLLFFKKEALAS